MCEKDILHPADYDKVFERFKVIPSKNYNIPIDLKSKIENLNKYIEDKDLIVANYKSFFKELSEFADEIYIKLKERIVVEDKKSLEELLRDIHNIFENKTSIEDLRTEADFQKILEIINKECKRYERQILD